MIKTIEVRYFIMLRQWYCVYNYQKNDYEYVGFTPIPEPNKFYSQEKFYPNTGIFRDLYPNGFKDENFWVVRELVLEKIV